MWKVACKKFEQAWSALSRLYPSANMTSRLYILRQYWIRTFVVKHAMTLTKMSEDVLIGKHDSDLYNYDTAFNVSIWKSWKNFIEMYLLGKLLTILFNVTVDLRHVHHSNQILNTASIFQRICAWHFALVPYISWELLFVILCLYFFLLSWTKLL